MNTQPKWYFTDPLLARIADWGHVLYHRTRTRAEIDFVARSFGGVAVESKYVDDRWGQALQTLAASQWKGALVQHRNSSSGVWPESTSRVETVQCRAA